MLRIIATLIRPNLVPVGSQFAPLCEPSFFFDGRQCATAPAIALPRFALPLRDRIRSCF
jgi:hypothetical protein